MAREMITYAPIGTIRTPFRRVEGMPVQSAAAGSIEGRVMVDAAHAAGLQDLEGFSHIILLYHFDRAAAPGTGGAAAVGGCEGEGEGEDR